MMPTEPRPLVLCHWIGRNVQTALAQARQYLMSGVVQGLAFQLVTKRIHHGGMQVFVIVFCWLSAVSHMSRVRQ